MSTSTKLTKQKKNLSYYKEQNNYNRPKDFTNFFFYYFHFALECENIKKTHINMFASVKQHYRATYYERDLWSLRFTCSIELLLKTHLISVIFN